MKRLSNYLIDLGRVVAYYPGLRRLTGSVAASILLCQFLYWCDKTEDGWIRKNSYDIEDETGLTYHEQKTARDILISLGILKEQYKRLDHEIWYKIDQEKLNSKWEEVTGKKKPEKEKEIPEGLLKGEQLPLPIEAGKDGEILQPVTSGSYVPRQPEKKGDFVDAMLAFNSSPANQKIVRMKEIKKEMETALHINTDSKKWEAFVEFAWKRETQFKEPVSTFLTWALRNGFDPIFWTPEKMKTLYPQAFVDNQPAQLRSDFVAPLPPRVEEHYAPMPKELTRKKVD